MSNTIQKINQPRDPSRREMLKRVGAAGAIGATVAVPVAQVTQQAHAQSNSGNLREALEVLAAIVQSGRPASQVLHLFDPFPQVLKNVRVTGEPKAVLDHSQVKAAIARGSETTSPSRIHNPG